MSRVAVSSAVDVDIDGLVNHLFDVPKALEKAVFPSHGDSKANIPVDVVDTPKELLMYMDLPGLSKSDIQVTIEDEKTLVVKSNRKRKHEESDEEGCKYLRLERRPQKNLMRKLRLPDNCNASAVTAKCENGVLTVTVEKVPLPPQQKPKTVQVEIC